MIPSIDYLTDKVGSKYALVIMASKRARQLVNGAPALVKCDSKSRFPLHWKEIAEGLVTIATPEEVKKWKRPSKNNQRSRPMLEGKKIAVGGPVALQPKVVTLVSRLVQAGAQVRVIMTDAATHLVSAAAVQGNQRQSCCHEPVGLRMREFNVEHVAIGRWCDVMVVAPATADIIGKMAGELRMICCPPP